MVIVLLVSPFVLGKHVFVLVSGCYRSDIRDKEGGRQMGHQEARKGHVVNVGCGNHRSGYLNLVVTIQLP